MESKRIQSKFGHPSVLLCLVCGGEARGINFNVATCTSCRLFFSEACTPTSEHACEFNDDRTITVKTRGRHSACRLKKCFVLGMNFKSIRCLNQTSIEKMEQEPIRLSKPATLSLLLKDRSALTFDG
ncbi:unnamed protein product [Rotaria socialis]|uniref:Nuclear receptor domain-containing protein n=1 Tax=Rotaria socialis TaxID=392032 RepID=A0A820EZD7_9BILA|nr:unnamed protein product [Rotaria socialis]